MMETNSNSLSRGIHLKSSTDAKINECNKSLLGKSRYGRTHKPKISEDFYDIDAVLDYVRVPVENSIASSTKPSKSHKIPPNRRKSISSTSTKASKLNLKPKDFVHVTGDSPDVIIPVAADKNEIENASNLTEDAQSVDVAQVLKIISVKQPLLLSDQDLKANSPKVVLKTYSNRRKKLQKPALVESFGLPDTPIFPVDRDKPVVTNEQKQIKNIDVFPQCLESEINIADKRLLDTPWKIGKLDKDDDFSDDISLGPFWNTCQSLTENKGKLVKNKQIDKKTNKNNKMVLTKNKLPRKQSLNITTITDKFKQKRKYNVKRSLTTERESLKKNKIKFQVEANVVTNLTHSPKKQKQQNLTTSPIKVISSKSKGNNKIVKKLKINAKGSKTKNLKLNKLNIDMQKDDIMDSKNKKELIGDISDELDDMSLLDRMTLSISNINIKDETARATSTYERIKKVNVERLISEMLMKNNNTLEALETKTSENPEDTDILHVGDLIWSRLGRYPYWPSIVAPLPGSEVYKKRSTRKRDLGSYLYHVRFFCDRGRRAWIPGQCILPYKTKDDIHLLYAKLKDKPNHAFAIHPYFIKPQLEFSWNEAVSELESLKFSSIQERLTFFPDMCTLEKAKLPIKEKNHSSTITELTSESCDVSAVKTKEELLDKILLSNNKKIKKKRQKVLVAGASIDESSTGSKQSRKAMNVQVTSSQTDVNANTSHVKKENLQNYLDEHPQAFERNLWQDVDIPKRNLSTPINEANSECSLSDSDSLSKSSLYTPIANTYQDEVRRHKHNNLFKGVSRQWVCQICHKRVDVFRCKGPCSGLFHFKCANQLLLFNSSDIKLGSFKTNEVIENKKESETQILTTTLKASMKKYDSKCEVSSIDYNDSDSEHHMLTPELPVTKVYGTLTLSEKIDLKMKEIMLLHETTNPRYADYTSSEECASGINISAIIEKKNGSKVKHTTDNVLKTSGTTDSNSSDGSIADVGVEDINKKQSGSSTANKEILNKNDQETVAEVEINSTKDLKCLYCVQEVDPPCFVCKKEVSDKNVSFRQKCSLRKCGKFYHPDCLKSWPQTNWSLISKSKPRNSDVHFDMFVCPMHVCHTCASDDPHAASSRCSSDKIVKCLECPATYHISNHCVPAGTLILSTSQIICIRHLNGKITYQGKPFSSKYSRTINTPWCFICSKGGHLICCETCPTSVHNDCLEVNLLEDGTFICEDCESGRYPLYDEIVWVKLGLYRWWPAEILFPNEVPEKIMNKPHGKGEFVVRFFGTHDHYWVTRGRVFLFQEGDKGHCNNIRKKVDALFKMSVEEATASYEIKKIFRNNKEAEINLGLKPPPYIRIKVNKPVGSVRLYDANVSNKTPCECKPDQENSCGPDSDCLNRLLLTECNPDICPAKDSCKNQRFEKRQYSLLEAFKTSTRGWGLKTLAPIYKGDFVIEYVGEVIDDQEYQRRIRKMHEQKDENYYFLIIDKDRIIDAGPKGNLARFMNHSCQPNCETQKWTVNGDTRVGLFANVDIPADTEVTFNYNLECIGKEKKPCICGASNCSGFIGVKSKMDEGQKRSKRNGTNGLKKKKLLLSKQTEPKNEGPCFICGETGEVRSCSNKTCTKLFHLHCLKLNNWPEGKWVCPSHNCNMCNKRTIRCCVKCVNSYCPMHSESNIRHDKLIGFICSEHDPVKASEVLLDQSVAIASKNTSSKTEETNVVSTTLNDTDLSIEKVNGNESISSFLETFSASDSENVIKPIHSSTPTKRKRKWASGNSKLVRKKKKIDEVSMNHKYVTSNLLDIPAQTEIKLSPSIPLRHLKTTRSSSSNQMSIESKRLLNQQSELEKVLPMRKRSRPRCEASL